MVKKVQTMIEYNVQIPYEEKGVEKTLGGIVQVWADRAKILRANDALNTDLSSVKMLAVAQLFEETAKLIEQFPKEGKDNA